MKRNENRMWFDKGYRQGVRDTKLDSFIPKTLGIFALIGLSFVSPWYPLMIFLFWTAIEYVAWKDRKEYGVDTNPPPVWEENI